MTADPMLSLDSLVCLHPFEPTSALRFLVGSPDSPIACHKIGSHLTVT